MSRDVDDISAGEEILLDLVEEITNKLHAGQKVDLDRYAREHPQYIDQLRMVLPSLELFVDLGNSQEHTLVKSHSSGDTAQRLEGCLGDYQILREVGRGGMGVVYETTHRSLGRRAALKVLPFAAMLDQRQIQRFKNEAQTVAQLDHPHIVDVFGVGCDRGVHYYAMRFIDGRTLSSMITTLQQRSSGDTAVDKAKKTDPNQDHSTSRAGGATQIAADGTARSGPTTPEPTPLPASFSTNQSTRNPAYFRAVANLVRQAAEALAYAHQQGVIHRDIKPSNLLLDDSGKLWVTDFGLAQVEDAATLTMTGDIVGTLRYMSPEQAQGFPIDHRADIYSLGATLYELLTLRPAFPQNNRQELSRKIVSEDPRAPKHLNHAIPTDLETIVLKTLEKNSAERYETADAFAEDLLRFTQDRSILARRPTFFDRAVKWSRRHRPVVGAIAAGLLIAIVSLIVSTLFMASAARVATQQRDEANTERARAVANERLALQALDEMFLDVFERRFPKEQLSTADHALMEKALQYYEAFAHQNRGHTSSRLETAKAYRRVGDIQSRLGQHKQAEDAYRKSIGSYQDLERDVPDEPDFSHGIASSTNSLGDSLQGQAKFDEADEAYRQALEIESSLVARFPAQAEYREERARLYNNLGVLLVTTKRTKEAEEAFLAARDQWQQLSDEPEAPPEYFHHLATSYINLANLWLGMDRQGEAKQTLAAAIEVARSLAHRSDHAAYQEQLARSLNSIGVLSMKEKETAEAEAAFREAVPIWEDLTIGYANVPEYREELVRTYSNMATLLGGKPEALQWRQRANDLLQRLIIQFPDRSQFRQQMAENNERLGELLMAGGQLQQASDAYVEANKSWNNLVDVDPTAIEYQRHLSATHNLLGAIYSKTGRPGEAKSAFQDALRVLDEISSDQSDMPGHRDAVARIGHNLGLLLGIGEVDASETYLRRSHSEFAKLGEAFPTNPGYQHALASSHTALGNLLYETDRRNEAEQQFLQALSIRETLAEKFPQMAAMQNSLAWFLVSCADTGIRDSERALKLAERAVSQSSANKGYWNTLGVAQFRTENFEDAIKSLKRSSSHGAASQSSDLFFLAMAHQRLGNTEIARLYYDQACEWMKVNKPNHIELRRFRKEAQALLGL